MFLLYTALVLAVNPRPCHNDHMNLFDLIVLIAAFVCFALAAFNVSTRINLVALGLAFWVLLPLVHAVRAVSAN